MLHSSNILEDNKIASKPQTYRSSQGIVMHMPDLQLSWTKRLSRVQLLFVPSF